MKGDNCSFRHDINKRGKVTPSNPSPNSFMQQNERKSSRTRVLSCPVLSRLVPVLSALVLMCLVMFAPAFACSCLSCLALSPLSCLSLSLSLLGSVSGNQISVAVSQTALRPCTQCGRGVRRRSGGVDTAGKTMRLFRLRLDKDPNEETIFINVERKILTKLRFEQPTQCGLRRSAAVPSATTVTQTTVPGGFF